MTYKDAAKAIEFYKQAFGAKEIMRFEVGGGIPHAEIMIGDSAIMLTEEWPEGGRYSVETLGNSPVLISLSVPDADAFVAHAVSAGAKVTLPLTDQFYGRREGTLIDPFGYVWSVSTVTEDMSVEEMHRRFNAMMKPQESEEAGGGSGSSGLPYADDVSGGARCGRADRFREKDIWGRRKVPQRGVGGRPACRGADRRFDADDWRRYSGWGMEGRAAAQCVPRVCAGLRCGLSACSGGGSDADCRSQRPGIWRTLGSVKDAAGNHWYIATRAHGDYKWEGAPDVQPYLHPLRAEPVINFLKRAFGAVELGRYTAPDGVMHHTTIKIGDSFMEMGEAQGPYQPMPTMFYLYVPNCDELYQRALAAGATSISEPKDQPYGDRSGAVKDVFGNQWYIATHFKDVEM